MAGLRYLTTMAVFLWIGTLRADAATVGVRDLALDPGEVGVIITEGAVDNESTFGVTVLIELVPQPGNRGTVTFTPAPPTDIGLAGDPWPGAGTFSPFDTDLSGSSALNGAVNDNGTFVPAPLTYDGLLAGFPVVASVDASGTWDVVLSTTSGDSSWEGLVTVLQPGIITVVNTSVIPAVSAWGLWITALLILTAGTAGLLRRKVPA